jgi:virulence factor Mce-like protein
MNRRERDPFVVGALVFAVIALVSFLGFTKNIPFVNEPFEIKAAFRDSTGLKPNSPVRIAGVNVGKVTSVEPAGGGTRAAIVKMAINDDARPIHEDARAKIRPRIFLEGNFFVDLEPGTSAAEELDGDTTIPVQRTATPVQFDQVLKILRRDTRTDVRSALFELGETQRAGGAHAFRRTLPDQRAAYRYASVVQEALLGERPGDLGDWVRAQGVVAQALDRDPQALKDLIVAFDTTAAALADRDSELRAAVGELPRALRAALPAFDALNAALPSVRAFAAAARPAIRSTGPAVDALLPAVRQLRGLVSQAELKGLAADLRSAAPGLARLSRTSVPLLGQLRALSGCTSDVLVPTGNDKLQDSAFPSNGPVYEELAKWLPGVAGESRSFDANGSWFKVLGQGGAETFNLGNGLFGTTLRPIVGVNPPADRTRPSLQPDVPCETQQTPDLRSIPGQPPPSAAANPAAPAARARYAKARKTALALLRRQLREQGSDTKVLDRDVTLRQIEQQAARHGLLAQLRRTLKENPAR